MKKLPLTVALIALFLVTPVPAQTVRESSDAVLDVSKVRVRNFGRINEIYYRGAQPKERDYEDLSALGVRTVINLTSHDRDATEQAMVEAAGMRYVQIPMTTRQPPTEVQLADFFSIVDDPANQPVYVHCVGGRHRTGVMTAAYRMSRHGWDAKQAFREMKKYDFGADFLHPEFKDFVFEYGAEAARKAAASGAATR
jgi:protein tyrosine/serine phosphatase